MNKFPPKVGILALTSALIMASACSTSGKQGTVVVDSANQDSRVNVLVLHHTSGDFQGSLNILTQPSDYPVSSHYLVPEPMDDSYEAGDDLKVYKLVDEGQRDHSVALDGGMHMIQKQS